MSTVNAADPFGLVAKGQTTTSAETASTDTNDEAAPAGAAPKQKRIYVTRGVTVQDDDPGNGELVMGYFSTGGLSIQKGKASMILTPSERAKLFAFMEKVE